MNAWRDGTIGMIDPNAPEIEESKAIRLCPWLRGVVEVVAVFTEPCSEAVVVFAAESLEESCTRCRIVDAGLRVFLPQALARRSVVSAEPRIRRHRRAVGVPRKYVGRNRA